MRASELLTTLVNHSVRIKVHNNELRWTAPKGAMTAALQREMVRHKSFLLEVFGTPNNSSDEHQPRCSLETRSLIAWLDGQRDRLPAGSFQLYAHARVTAPERWYRVTRLEALKGNERAIRDLRRVKELMQREELP